METILENLSKDIKNIEQLDSYNALIEKTQRISKIQLNLKDKYIIMSKEMSELKKEIREIHQCRQESPEFNKHINT